MTQDRVNGVLLILIALFGLFGQNGFSPSPSPNPPSRLYAVIVEETHTGDDTKGRTPEHAAIILSKDVRDLFEKFLPVDKDTPVTPDVKVLVDTAMRDHGVSKLPILFIVDPDTKHIWYEGVLPINVEEIRSIVNNIKGGHS